LPKILLVDDDIVLGERVKEWLETTQSADIEFVNTGEDALQLLTSFGYDLLILDWNLPGMTGVEVCHRYRQSGGEAPVLFLTGRSDINDKEDAFNRGGDDYLSKPFELRELSARCQALLRRSRAGRSLSNTGGKLVLKPEERLLIVEDKQLALTKLECSLLTFLMSNAGKPYSAADLLKHVWPSEKASSEDSVRMLIRGLRKKLAELDPDQSKQLIQNAPGGGYIYQP